MVLLAHKLSRSGKTGSRMEDHLRIFITKISSFINQTLLKPQPSKCFDLINVANRAFAHMIADIDYPISKWGTRSIEEYLTYTLNLLDLLNSITSSLSHLNQSKISILHAISSIENLPSSSAINDLKRRNIGKDFKLQNSIVIEDSPSGSEKERVIIQGLTVLKKTGILALGFILSGLKGNDETYMEVRKVVLRRSDEPVITGLDSRFLKEMNHGVEEFKEVNGVIEGLCSAIATGSYYDEHVREVKRKWEDTGNLINNFAKQGNDLFSQVLETRNKVMQSLRLTGKNS